MQVAITRSKSIREGLKAEEIVKASGVSRSTVFRYLGGKAVRPAAATAIERAIEVLSAGEEDSVPGRKEILVSLPPTYTSFRGYAEVLEGLFERARERGAAISIDASRGATRPPQGVVVIGKQIADEDLEIERWGKAGVPCVLVNRILEDEDRSWVAVDCRRAAAEAVRHLIGVGCRRIAAWIDEGSRVSRDKLRGYRDAIEEAGLAELSASPAAAGLEETFASLMASADPPDGWFSPDDEIGARVMALAAAGGIAVPEALAVAGMNDLSAAPGLDSALTSVRLPFREMGEAAFDALERLIDRPSERSVRILLSHRLVERASSARPASARTTGRI